MAKYKRYENKFNDPRQRPLHQVVSNEIVFSFKGEPTTAKKIADIINKDKLWKREVNVRMVEDCVKLGRLCNLFKTGNKIGAYSSRLGT